MNLITEYQKRHKSCSIPVCHDGVCFFDYEGQPNLIALTSLSCRTFSTCAQCNGKNANVVVETFRAGASGSFMMASHNHIDPCSDLIKHVNETARGYSMTPFSPFYAKSPRDLEIWLWKFCTLHSPKYRVKSVETDPSLKVIEQMAYCVQKHSKIYQAYYIAHEVFLVQRKYLLFGEK